MADPVDRFTFARVACRSQALVLEGQPLFFVDLIPEDPDFAYETVTIGWSADRSKFGVYVNGICVYPPNLDDTDDIITDEETDP